MVCREATIMQVGDFQILAVNAATEEPFPEHGNNHVEVEQNTEYCVTREVVKDIEKYGSLVNTITSKCLVAGNEIRAQRHNVKQWFGWSDTIEGVSGLHALKLVKSKPAKPNSCPMPVIQVQNSAYKNKTLPCFQTHDTTDPFKTKEVIETVVGSTTKCKYPVAPRQMQIHLIYYGTTAALKAEGKIKHKPTKKTTVAEVKSKGQLKRANAAEMKSEGRLMRARVKKEKKL